MERNGSNLLRSDRVCSVQDDAVLPMPGDFAVLNAHPCAFLYIKSRRSMHSFRCSERVWATLGFQNRVTNCAETSFRISTCR
jgi:hypothetical protein